MKSKILLWILFGLIGIFIFTLKGCVPSIQYPIKKVLTIRPLEENKYEIAGKEIYEGMIDD